jgi:hypothetical protein
MYSPCRFSCPRRPVLSRGLLRGGWFTKGEPEPVALPPGEQRRSVLSGSLVQRELTLSGYSKLEDGLKATAKFFRDRLKG